MFFGGMHQVCQIIKEEFLWGVFFDSEASKRKNAGTSALKLESCWIWSIKPNQVRALSRNTEVFPHFRASFQISWSRCQTTGKAKLWAIQSCFNEDDLITPQRWQKSECEQKERHTDWWRSRSSCGNGWTRCWNRWPEHGCSRSSSPAGRRARWRSGPLPSPCRCPPPENTNIIFSRAHKCVMEEAPPTGLTLIRQELLTSCLGSTTSTRGSFMATSLMQDMSKPYTFSHPETDHTKVTATPRWTLAASCVILTVDFVVLVLPVFNGCDIECSSVRENESIRLLWRRRWDVSLWMHFWETTFITDVARRRSWLIILKQMVVFTVLMDGLRIPAELPLIETLIKTFFVFFFHLHINYWLSENWSEWPPLVFQTEVSAHP